MRKIVFMAALLAMLLAFVVPAHAAGPWVGSVSTGCTTRLDDFPNAPPADPNSDDCDGDANGAPGATPVDFAAGVIQSDYGTWTASSQGATRTTFSYDENCTGVPNGAFPAFGSASGNFLIDGAINGVKHTLLAGFTWQRTGLVAQITTGASHSGKTDVGSGSKLIGDGLAGFDTDGNFTTVEKPAPAGTTGASVGLLLVQVESASGGNTCPAAAGGQWQVVTPLSSGETRG